MVEGMEAGMNTKELSIAYCTIVEHREEIESVLRRMDEPDPGEIIGKILDAIDGLVPDGEE